MNRKKSLNMFKSIECVVLIIFLNSNSIETTQKSIPNIRPIPIFSTDTINKVENIVLYNNAPLNTEILVAQAKTYDTAMPIRYALIDDSSLFKINPLSGAITLYNTITKLGNYKFTIVAYDSAPFPDNQSAFLTANVAIVSSINYAPAFNDYIPYYVSVLDIINPNTIIYDEITINDNNFGQNGAVNVFCNPNSIENLDANISCSYFRPEIQMIDIGTFRVLIRLIQKLDYNVKRSFLMSIGARLYGPTNLITFANILIDVKSSSAYRPKFEKSSYLLLIDLSTKIYSNVLKLIVNNVLDPRDTNFEIYDPKDYFRISNRTSTCRLTYCVQYIQLKSSQLEPTQYSFQVKFRQAKFNIVQKDEALINVVVKRPQVAENPPIFVNKSFVYTISESLKPGEVARNVSIIVYEPDRLSAFTSGFFVDLLNPDLTLSNDVFEVTPNYGIGYLVCSLRLKETALLDYENGKQKYEFMLRATSKSSNNLISYAKLNIFIKDHNEFTPIFQYPAYTTILNNPENYQKDDIILQVKGLDFDNNGLIDLTYSINGPHKDRFYINSAGQIALLKPFDLSKDLSYYNLTLSVTDPDGLCSSTYVNVYLNITSPSLLKNSFECTLLGVRSELNINNGMSLIPPLFIQVNSILPLKYVLLNTIPPFNGIAINEFTGEVTLTSPLNNYILSNYDRIILNVQIYQIQPYETNDLYLSSIICSATIYLKRFNEQNLGQQVPYFLGQYTITIDRESIFKTIPLLKVDAISMNPSNPGSISYSIVGSNDDLFVIDSFQGFLYSRYDLGLKPRIYTVQIKATDQSNNLYSITNAFITVTYKSNHMLKCDTDYLIIRLSSYDMLYNANDPLIFGRISCVSDSPFNDSSITYIISSSLASFDCKGNQIDYTPKIGIDSTNGNIASFESLNTDKFCDSSFLITVKQDDSTLLIPFKLILIQIFASQTPIFINTNTNITNIPSFVYVNSQITTVTAYDPSNQRAIDNYVILSEISTPFSAQKYFRINSKTGIIYLIDLPLVKKVELTIQATSSKGLSSSIKINIDLSSFINNYYPNLKFDVKLPDSITLYDGKVYNDPIYQANLICYAKSNSTPTGCGTINYDLKYLPNENRQINFIIEQETANIYFASSNINNRLEESKYLIIINAQSQYYTNELNRHVNNVQKNLTILVLPSGNDIPAFDFSSYKIQILDNTPIGTNILTMKYKSGQQDINLLDFKIEQQSNIQIDTYFGLNYLPSLNILNIIVKSSPIPKDKPDISFIVRITDKKTTFSSYSTVNIKLLPSNNYFLTSYPAFISPFNASYIIVLNRANLVNNTIIFKFSTTNPNGNSNVVYRILNKDVGDRFFIENDYLKIVYPIISDLTTSSFKRFSYLLFIEANDLENSLLQPTYTTLDIRLNNILDIYPYFLREPSSGKFSIDLTETTNLDESIFDLTPYVYRPLIETKLPLTYYYTYNNYEPYSISDTFYVDYFTNQLKLNKTLNATRQNYYNLLIYVTYVSNFNIQYYKPSPFDLALFFIDVYVNSINSYSLTPSFLDYSQYILIEELMPIDAKIGYIYSNDSKNIASYSFDSCDYMSKSMIYRDNQFCSLFKIDSSNGIISTNASNYAAYRKGSFSLRITSGYSQLLNKNLVEVKVFIVSSNEKSRFVFKQPTSVQTSNFLIDIKREINSLLNAKYKDKYYFDFFNLAFIFSTKIKTELDACFYLLNIKKATIESHKKTINVINSLNNIRIFFETYSISEIERCSNRQDEILYGDGILYDKNGNWLFTPYSLGLICLAGITFLFILASIFTLVLCWLSHMRQALLAPSDDNDIFETSSNNLLLD